MSNYITNDTELTSIADAIRTKAGTSSTISYPDGFVTAIENIPSGGAESMEDIMRSYDMQLYMSSKRIKIDERDYSEENVAKCEELYEYIGGLI